MTSKYYAWLDALAKRDQTLVILTVIAAALVAAWIGLDYVPVRWRDVLRRVYLAGGVALYILTLYASVFGGTL